MLESLGSWFQRKWRGNRNWWREELKCRRQSRKRRKDWSDWKDKNWKGSWWNTKTKMWRMKISKKRRVNLKYDDWILITWWMHVKWLAAGKWALSGGFQTWAYEGQMGLNINSRISFLSLWLLTCLSFLYLIIISNSHKCPHLHKPMPQS